MLCVLCLIVLWGFPLVTSYSGVKCTSTVSKEITVTRAGKHPRGQSTKEREREMREAACYFCGESLKQRREQKENQRVKEEGAHSRTQGQYNGPIRWKRRATVYCNHQIHGFCQLRATDRYSEPGWCCIGWGIIWGTDWDGEG